ncbi:hypothetical protein D3C76_1378210 [compost metagenome]
MPACAWNTCRRACWISRAFDETGCTRLMSKRSGGGSMPRCRYGAMSSISCSVPRLSSRAARISGVTGDSAMLEASTAISSSTLRAPWVSISSRS